MTTIDTSSATTPRSNPRPLPHDIWFANTFMRVLADQHSTGGQFALIEQRAAKDFSPPTHVHNNEDQLLFVVEGSITARLGDEESTVAEGESVWLPRGVPHTFRVESDEARLLEITTPGGFEDFHIELGAEATEARIPEPGPIDVAAMVSGGVPFGTEILGPPMT